MTATCPPSLRSGLLSSLGILDCHVIHAATDRPEISYNVRCYQTTSEASKALITVVNTVLKSKKDDPSYRTLVYCRSKETLKSSPRRLGASRSMALGLPKNGRLVSRNGWMGGKRLWSVRRCWGVVSMLRESQRFFITGHRGPSWILFRRVDELAVVDTPQRASSLLL